MTVLGTSNRQAAQACDGVTILFELTLEYNVEEEITATLRHKTTNAETELTLNSDFEIPVSPDPDAGNVRLIGDYATSPPSSSYELHIIRILPLTQSSTFNGLNSISAGTTIEARVDKMTMMVQQLQDQLNRCIIIATTLGITGVEFPVRTAGSSLKIPAWNTACTALELISGDVSLTYQGAWDSETTYAVNDVVTNDGSCYICILASTNNEPPNATYWAVLAAAGEDGTNTDEEAIHDNVAGEINAITGKTTPVGGDLFIIEDSAASNNKKKLTFLNFYNALKSALDSVYAAIAHKTQHQSGGSDILYQYHRYVWHFNGDCEVAANDIIHRVGTQAETVVDVYMTVPSGDEPTGASLIADIKKDGVTIFSTKPEIDASGTEEDGNHVVSDSSLAADAQISAEITQIGSTLPGSNLTLILLTKEPIG